MGFSKNSSASNAPKMTIALLEQLHAAVRNVRLVSDTLVTFTLSLDGLSLYGMRLCEGSKGRFIAPPTEKGRDNKYYKLYGVWLDDAAQEWLTEKVLAALEG